jgi:hypothetical protein
MPRSTTQAQVPPNPMLVRMRELSMHPQGQARPKRHPMLEPRQRHHFAQRRQPHLRHPPQRQQVPPQLSP